MKPADHMHFGNAQAECRADRAYNVVDGPFKGMGIAFFGGKCAELARKNADIGVVNVTIHNVGNATAILPFADRICNNPERVEII